jgi:hypothetical protein
LREVAPAPHLDRSAGARELASLGDEKDVSSEHGSHSGIDPTLLYRLDWLIFPTGRYRADEIRLT